MFKQAATAAVIHPLEPTKGSAICDLPDRRGHALRHELKLPPTQVDIADIGHKYHKAEQEEKA